MHIVAACTQSKRVPPTTATAMRTYVAELDGTCDAAATATSWCKAMAEEVDLVSAIDLYKGNYWHAVKRVRDHLDEADQVLVMSAGAGLYRVEDLVRPYAATFNARHHDSVPDANTQRGRKAWWHFLGGDAALRALSTEEGVVVFVLPDSYLNVAGDDVRYLHDQLPAGQCIVFGSQPAQKLTDRLRGGWVQLDARMTRVFRCNVSALAPSALLYCLAALPPGQVFTVEHARNTLAALQLDDAPPLYPKRKKRTPEQVMEWLSEELEGMDPPRSASAALRRLRNQGFAFEQKRFHQLFHRISGPKVRTGTSDHGREGAGRES